MRHWLFALSLLLFLATSSFSAERPAKIVRAADYLAVFDLEITGQVDRAITRPLSENIRSEVIRSGKYKVMERSQMDKVLKEQAFQMTGCVAKECMVEAGQLLGVGKIIIGSLGLVGRTYHLSLSQVNVETGETEQMAVETCKCEVDELIESSGRAARRLMGEVAEPPPNTAGAGTATTTAAPSLPSGKTYRDRTTGMELVLIPAGRFTMGSPASESGRNSDEGPQHEVQITRPFYLGKYEVTQAQWRAIMGNNPSGFQGCDDCPVEQVSWNDIQEFIRRLNEKAGRTGYRLPTEAEWEYACRAGSQTAYSFGDDPGSLEWFAWYSKNSDSKTHPVGQKRPNAWGFHDMQGNVWEWCQDWHGNYASGLVSDPTGPGSGSDRVIRGGSWYLDPGYLRASSRYGFRPSYRYASYGFRLALPAQ
ncbi:MAG: SUMF1/EgtB/PvdO family nonheme iron enzyme [bacterium]